LRVGDPYGEESLGDATQCACAGRSQRGADARRARESGSERRLDQGYRSVEDILSIVAEALHDEGYLDLREALIDGPQEARELCREDETRQGDQSASAKQSS
jgi:hypothetical protein